MFRSTKYCYRLEYISIQLSTHVTELGGNANQRKDGYTFLTNDRSSFFDWYNAYLDITFKVNKLADGTGYANDDAIAMINDTASLISDLWVKQNGKVVYNGTNLFRVTNIRDLLEMSQDYAKTTGTSKYFHIDTSCTTVIEDDTFAHWRDHNYVFLACHGLIFDAAEVKSIIPLNKITFFDGLRTNILPPSHFQLDFGLTLDNNLIYRANGINAGRVVVIKFML